jgi:DNA-binding NarL/FixJ family response regulator
MDAVIQMYSRNPDLSPLIGLIETLELLTEQARVYEDILPLDNYPARAVAAALGELAGKAMNEAYSLQDALNEPPSEGHPFSKREHQVLTLAAHGLTNKEIAYRLAISERTVQFHMNSCFNKTGTSSRTEVVALALGRGWIALN